MIYTIAEHSASIVECLILFSFIISCLDYKSKNKARNILITGIFFIFTIINISIWDTLGILLDYTIPQTTVTILILLSFARISLYGTISRQALIIMLGITVLFFIDIIIISISSLILNENYATILIMRNPARIFLLVISKLLLAIILIFLCKFIRYRKTNLHFIQSVAFAAIFVVFILIGTAIEKMILEQAIPIRYASIILISISIIAILLFFVLLLFFIQSSMMQKQVALETRLLDDASKLKESIEWNESVRAIRHDMRNHMMTVQQLLNDGNVQEAKNYLKTLSKELDAVPNYTNTTCSAFNALLDLKRLTCKREHIDLKCYIQTQLPKCNDVALCTIFGNLMDNAIEAEQKEKQPAIRICIDAEEDLLHLIVQNRISTPVLKSGKMPATSKHDNEHHGLGFRNVMETVSRENGSLDMFEQDEWLIVDVLLPANKKIS
jgi:hypothetical protein